VRVRAGRAIAWLSLAVLLGTAAPAAAAPRVHVIATGGTIANDPAGRLTPAQLVRSLPGRDRLGDVSTEAFSNVSSMVLSMDDWLRLARRVAAVFLDDPDLDGVVVTSGTDTMEELAWFLHLAVPDPRPIVVVGAMRRPADRRADGPRNLADAIRVAGSREARRRGTLVVMNGQVHRAVDARKHHTTAVSAFDRPPAELEGVVAGGSVRFSRAARTERPATVPLGPETVLPRVDVLLTYQGAPADLIGAAVDAGARGLVLAAAGAGALTRAQREAAHRAARAGVPVVIAARAGRGDVTAQDPLEDVLLSAGSLDPLKARLLLMAALASGVGGERLKEIFPGEVSAPARRTDERSDTRE
jgi:L-asparaginase